MFDIVPGSESKALEKKKFYEIACLASGYGRKTIFMNGGSEARRAVRDHWISYAERLGIGYRVYGNCMIIIGGRPRRGQRLVSGQIVDRRKAKRIARNNRN
jgi:hypothetical protein